MVEIILYIALIVITSMGGYYIKSLSLSGSIATFITGCCVVIGFGWRGLFVLGAFFLTSSLWSKYKHQQKGTLNDMLEKGARRDWIQVVANGSIASISSLLFFFTNENIWLYAFITSIAAANADTWASEIGVLSKRKPIYILSGKMVEKGTSGAISWLGTLSSLGASLFIGLLSFSLFSIQSFTLLLLVILIGFLGSVIDTLLGATIQAIYQCKICGLKTEKKYHCREKTFLIKGANWCNNDIVNVSSIFIATLIFVFSYMIFVGY
ncbi:MULTISPECIES: DUF92 domain-containing protein [Bacillus]|uniref:DUF92 domain-containing protein n=1 Tax=Bacillus TaxID=1386 RepID=UPI0003777FEF|nr:MULTISPECIES: DUF92 domain-containing protein [Bacillus]